MDDTNWGRSSRLWTLFEWSCYGAGLILTLIWLSVNGCLNFVVTPNKKRWSLRHKRVLITTSGSGGDQIEIGGAIANRLRNDHNCSVISLKTVTSTSNRNLNGLCKGAEAEDIICDLTSSRDVRTQVQRIWEQLNGIDLVINCEGGAQDTDVGQRVTEIGSNIQQMINLLIALVPKMCEKGTGRFAIVRNCHPKQQTQCDFTDSSIRSAGEYDELLQRLVTASSVVEEERPEIDLVQIYCRTESEQGKALFEVVDRILSGIVDSGGDNGVIDVTKNNFWATLVRKLRIRRKEEHVDQELRLTKNVIKL